MKVYEELIRDWNHHTTRVKDFARETLPPTEKMLRTQFINAAGVSSNAVTDFDKLSDPSPGRPSLSQVVHSQAKVEPPTAKCDGIIYTSASLTLPHNDVRKTAKAYRDFSLIQSGPDPNVGRNARIGDQTPAGQKQRVESGKDTSILQQASSDSAAGSSPEPAGDTSTNPPSYDSYLDAAFSAPCRVEDITSCQEVYDTVHAAQPADDKTVLPDINALEISLPQLVIEYKKSADTRRKSLNQVMMYSVAATTFLGAVGISDHPVFSLAADGSTGGIMMTWRSSEKVCGTGFLFWYVSSSCSLAA